MIIIGLAIVLLGLLVFVFTWRGRIVAKGQFCRKCRFDLAGLDLDPSDAKCPECGNEVNQQSARRTILRRRSRVGLTIACVLMLAGIGSVGMGAAGQTRAMVAAMPDSIVLFLTDMGMDEALDELHTRTSFVPSTMSAKDWDHAIEAGLAHQADTTIIWDVRWGEVLYQGIDHGQMSNDQLGRYFVNAYEIELAVRDRVHPGDSGFGYKLNWELTRWKMLTGGATAYRFGPRVVSYGIVGEGPIWKSEPRRRGGGGALRLLPYASNKMSMWTKTYKMAQYFELEPGETVDVFLEYEAMLRPMDDDEAIFAHRIRKEFKIKVVDLDEPIVPSYQDEKATQLVIDNIRIGPLQMMKDIGDLKPIAYIDFLTTTLLSPVGLAQLSLEIFVLIDEQETQIGTATYNYSPDSFGAHVGWTVNPREKKALELAMTVHTKLVEAQSATIIVRTSPELVDDIPGIDRVLDVELMFVEVPILIVKSIGEMNSPDWEAERTKAQPIDD